MHEVTFSQGETIFREGDPPSDGVYLILEGRVEISTQQDDEKVSLAILNKEDVLGEMALLDNTPAQLLPRL